MIRYMDLIVKILQYVERHGNGKRLPYPKIEGYDCDQICYHIRLCAEAGFLHTDNPHDTVKPTRNSRLKPVSLTWKGHEFLDEKVSG